MGIKGSKREFVSKPEGIERRKRIMNTIKDYISVKGFPPTVREIGIRVQLNSSSTVHRHMEILIRQGYISMEKGIPRSIRILKDFD